MAHPKNDHIFPEGMFPKRAVSEISESDMFDTKTNTPKKEIGSTMTPAFHIPYKKEACRLSRKVHLTEEAYQELHITDRQKTLKSATSSPIEAPLMPKKKALSVGIKIIPVASPKIAKALLSSSSIIPVPLFKKRTSIQTLGSISVSKKEQVERKCSATEKTSITQQKKHKQTKEIPVAIGEPTRSGILRIQSPPTVQTIIAESRQKLLQLAQTPVQKQGSERTHTQNKTKKYPSFFRSSFQKKKQKTYTPKTEKKSAGMLGEIVRFGATTAAIFIVSFAVMNASALSELFSAKLNPIAAVQKQIALEKVVGNKYVPILPTAGMKHENHKNFPALDIKIGPLENRIIIPKIGKNVPVVDVPTDALQKGDWGRLENDIQTALKDGVVHYPGTAHPGQIGNVFITGHSSYYLWDPGKYKDVFVRLHDMDVGDEFTIFWNQDVYHYRIRERKVVAPEETSVLKQPNNERIATLMTCTPIGTAKNRLVLVAEQI